MKVITFQAIKALELSPACCYQWAAGMIAEKPSAILPPKISMKPAEGVFCNVMPGIFSSGGESWGGVKLVTRYPGRSPSLDSKLLLFDAATGECRALMDANWITAMRTGAVAAHSVLLFAKPGFSRLGIMGLGNTARAALLVLAAMLPEKELDIALLRYKGQEQLFAGRFSSCPNLHFSYVDTPEELAAGREVVLSAVTYVGEDICPDSCFEEGVLVVPIHTRGFTNCDLFFDKIFADDYGHVCHFKNFSRFRAFAEVSDVVNGRKAGRESDRERILAYNIGIALHDICFAAHIYKRLENTGLPELSLEEPAEKFWI
ncbi:MAG: ornithine cyclodeaminase [Provencibacterium sp.]|nr:ornithine cyclodeaminase [Provencibacterium sp.]